MILTYKLANSAARCRNQRDILSGSVKARRVRGAVRSYSRAHDDGGVVNGGGRVDVHVVDNQR